METYVWIIICFAALAAGVVAGFFAGKFYRKRVSEASIGSAEEEANRIVNDAVKEAETKRKEILVEAKEEALRQKTEADRELKDRRRELTNSENRILKKEEALDRKTEAAERTNEQLQKKLREAESHADEIKRAIAEQRAVLERISGLTVEQAKSELLESVSSEIEHETAMKIAEYERQFKETSEEKARNILTLAIQRCAADQVAEVTVSSVTLPNDEMKGRLIGRGGRNIRSIEQLTGVDLIIDDTPESITLSSFDPVRREVARIAIEKLMQDGRIHPTRIEETVEKARHEVDLSIRQAGERATFDTGVHGLNPELVKLLGRLKYRTSYGQNVLNHSIEVSLLSGILADELGVDATLARRAGLLHDIGKALTQEAEGTHVQLGVEAAKKYRESRDVIHVIESHHNDVEPRTLVALIVQAADAISAARPGARRENLENYIKRLSKLEEITNEFEGVEKSYAIQAGREIRIMVKPETVNDDKMKILAHDIAKRIESELEYPGQIKVHIIRESRYVDYAK
ncbi:MAG: ribonuclease Y [Firmicutes bacterium]|nr:ribonuclease Y [Bacillota bacterium]